MIIEMIFAGLAIGAASSAGSHYMDKWLGKDKKESPSPSVKPTAIPRPSEKPDVQEEKSN